MFSEETGRGPESNAEDASQALSAPDPAAALRKAVSLYTDQNTRPVTLDRRVKLRDKVSAVTSFFEFAGKHLGDVTPEDVSRWRSDDRETGVMREEEADSYY